MSQEFRIESDSMGEMKVPANAYYAAQTARAVENFPISGLRFPRRFIQALGLIKQASAKVNRELKLLEPKLADAIAIASAEVADGNLDPEFVLDIFQTGSGTSTNMNANEVIANRTAELLGGRIGDKRLCHPNDHVNLGQSSNDVIPSAIHVAASMELEETLLPSLRGLEKSLGAKAAEFDKIVKIGRTHLQDATPIRLGQEFSGYASMVAHGIRRIESCRPHLHELAIGGTAVGTGINTHLDFAHRVCAFLAGKTGIPFREAENHFEAQGSRDAVVETSGALKTLATSLLKIANDIRWLASGPRCGIGEIRIPAIQPGSSIMPGKVNPVIPEAVIMVCAQVTGNDLAVTLGGQGGHFDLNVMMPLMAHNLLESIRLLGTATRVFTEKCVNGIEADESRCRDMIEQSLAMCTALTPKIGYDRAAALAKEAYRSGKTIRELVRENGLIPEDELAQLLDPWRMTEPGE